MANSPRAIFQAPTPKLRHLELPLRPTRLDHAASSSGGKSLRQVERREHALKLRQQLDEVRDELTQLREGSAAELPPADLERVLVFETEPGHPLSADQAYSLCTGSKNEVIQVLQFVDADDKQISRVLLHVPFGELLALSEKIRYYGEGQLTDKGNAPNPWIANLSRIGRAALQDMWTDKDPLPSDDEPRWWQLWVRRYPVTNAMAFKARCPRSGIEVSNHELKLPEHSVFMGRCTRATLEASFGILNTLSEVRLGRPVHLEFTDLSGQEQQEYIFEALDRILPPTDDSPAVCIFDTGIQSGHPLIARVLQGADNLTVFSDGDASDCYPGSGHGTLMAGVAAYGDLRELMASTTSFETTHRVEGVKIYDPAAPEAELGHPPAHGWLTIEATGTIEAHSPHRSRIFAMAITAPGEDTGRPSAWSAAIDQLAYGDEEGEGNQRLFLVSAANVVPSEYGGKYLYPDHNHQSPIEDPAQAWNAVTVGALTHYDEVKETDPESAALQTIASSGQLSPFSRTSIAWDDHWPIKPDIVLEGGNCAVGVRMEPEIRDSIVPLSTSKSFRQRPIAAFNATSAATALAANLTSKILATYPDLWPETIRALVIHSARWSATMLGEIDPHSAYTREGRAAFRKILRCYGYGEPDAFRARFSSEQEVTLFRQDSLIPYRGSAGSASSNDCHIHELKLPAALLGELLDVSCTLRVTLSCFISPNPSTSNRTAGSRYRYGGCLLRFRVRSPEQSPEDFIATVAKSAAEDDEADDGDESLEEVPASKTRANSGGWALGPKLRDKGASLIHDVWRGNAAELALMDRIAIYPVKGWWASRTFPVGSPWHKCHLRPIRYSLVVSVEVAADVPLYTEISNLLSTSIDA